MDVFLFPLVDVTLFPGCTKPFHIYEPRYLRMVRDAVATSTPVAVGFIEDLALMGPTERGRPVSFVRPIAGYGQVEIVEEHGNGTLLVFIKGTGRCHLGAVISESPYIVCQAEPIPESAAVDLSLMDRVQTLNRILARWITHHLPDPRQREVFMNNLQGPQDIVGACATYLVRDDDLQQVILELDNLNERIVFLHRLVESNEISAS